MVHLNNGTLLGHKNELSILIKTWMNIQRIMLNEKAIRKIIYYVIPII
jgi:hypothetical protein